MQAVAGCVCAVGQRQPRGPCWRGRAWRSACPSWHRQAAGRAPGRPSSCALQRARLSRAGELSQPVWPGSAAPGRPGVACSPAQVRRGAPALIKLPCSFRTAWHAACVDVVCWPPCQHTLPWEESTAYQPGQHEPPSPRCASGCSMPTHRPHAGSCCMHAAGRASPQRQRWALSLQVRPACGPYQACACGRPAALRLGPLAARPAGPCWPEGDTPLAGPVRWGPQLLWPGTCWSARVEQLPARWLRLQGQGLHGHRWAHPRLGPPAPPAAAAGAAVQGLEWGLLEAADLPALQLPPLHPPRDAPQRNARCVRSTRRTAVQGHPESGLPAGWQQVHGRARSDCQHAGMPARHGLSMADTHNSYDVPSDTAALVGILELAARVCCGAATACARTQEASELRWRSSTDCGRIAAWKHTACASGKPQLRSAALLTVQVFCLACLSCVGGCALQPAARSGQVAPRAQRLRQLPQHPQLELWAQVGEALVAGVLELGDQLLEQPPAERTVARAVCAGRLARDPSCALLLTSLGHVHEPSMHGCMRQRSICVQVGSSLSSCTAMACRAAGGGTWSETPCSSIRLSSRVWGSAESHAQSAARGCVAS